MLDCSCKVKDNFLYFSRKKVNKLSEKLLQRFCIEIGWDCFDLYLFIFSLHYSHLKFKKNDYPFLICKISMYISQLFFSLFLKVEWKLKLDINCTTIHLKQGSCHAHFFLYIKTISRKWFIQTLCFVSKFSIKWIPCHV